MTVCFASSLAGCHRDAEPTQKATTAAAPVANERRRVPTVVPGVVTSMGHAHGWFTQGLAFSEGRLFEGTGMYGESQVLELDPRSGRELRHVTDDALLFGEGVTVFRGELYQLTWREHVCLVYDAATLKLRRQIAYDGEGWGITSDGDSIVTSDGSSTLSYRDPQTFRVLHTLPVTYEEAPLVELNELEMVRGEIWANVWQTDFIVRISPATGRVIGRLDLSAIRSSGERSSDPDDVLNGIAFDERSGRILVTGKRWPRVFEIALPADSATDVK